MLACSIRSPTTLVAVIAGILMLSAGYTLADKVEVRKLPSYSAFDGFVLAADAPEDPAWLIPAYEHEGWQAEAVQDDWERSYAIEWQAAGGKLITRERSCPRACAGRSLFSDMRLYFRGAERELCRYELHLQAGWLWVQSSHTVTCLDSRAC